MTVEISDPVQIESGYISGTVSGEPGKEVRIYRGIPYAAPPVGELRWKPPQSSVPWSGVLECKVFSNTAPQPPGPGSATGLKHSEDCLYLNVLTPAKEVTDKLPVMVWMHGGGYSNGSGNDVLQNSPSLPQHGVVLVTINKRLGVLGLLAHPLLGRESPHGVSGNYMCLDMIAALKWVQKNIAAFGGDPDNITIFGQSGGSWKVIDLMVSPLAKGLFHKVIGQSGTPWGSVPLNTLPLKEIEASGERLFAKLGVDVENDPLATARAISWEKIIEADSALARETGAEMPRSNWDIAVDGWFLPDAPAGIFGAGKQNPVPFIMGGNMGEITGPGSPLMPGIIPTYVEMFSGASRAGINAYAYIFDHVPAGWKRDGCVATHAMELPYVFGGLDSTAGGWYMINSIAGQAGAKSSDPGITDADIQISEAMMTMWAQFARTGDPSVEGLVTWPDYQAATDRYLYIAGELEVKSGFSRIYPKK